MTVPDSVWRYELAVGATILILIVIRLVCAAVVPIAFDEALYWRWSQHLAGGFLDHPPMNPVFIRIGTALFGHTSLGVRVVGILMAVPATWAVWRSANILFADRRVGAAAALFFNLTLVMAVGSMLATPDGPVVIMACFLLFSLSKVWETDCGAWWLAAGVVFGLGLASKYSMLFFAASMLIWTLAVPRLRRWLLTVWPWAAAAVSVATFSPVLIWNWQHDWASILFHVHRLAVHEWSIRYVGEFFAGQIGLATPPIFVLGGMGLFDFLTRKAEPYAARMLISALVWPITLYFVWHTFHDRVQGNWPEPMYPAFVIAAAVAAHGPHWRGATAAVARWSQRLAVPFGLGMAALIYLQAVFAIIPADDRDPIARKLGVGWTTLAAQIDDVRKQIGAPLILARDYGVTSWLAFYVPSHPPVEEIGGRMRWVDAPQPAAELFRGPMLYVCWRQGCELTRMREKFQTVEYLTTLDRTRRGVTIDRFMLYRVAGPVGPPLEP